MSANSDDAKPEALGPPVPPPARPALPQPSAEAYGRTVWDFVSENWWLKPLAFLLPLLVALLLALAGYRLRDDLPFIKKPSEKEAGVVQIASRGPGALKGIAPATDSFQPPQPGFLLIVANGSSKATGKDFRSTATLTISVDGKVCAAQRFYLPNNWEVGSELSATCLVPVVAAQNYNIEARVEGEGSTSFVAGGTYHFLPQAGK